MNRATIVIVGGGFAGVKCAKVLRRKLPKDRARIVVFNRENHMVFHPLLAEVVGASINPDVTGTPLRQILPGVQCRTTDIKHVDLERRRVEFELDDGRPGSMSYDHLVLAGGVGANLGMVPGMSDHAFPFKTVGDALALRNHVLELLEKAELCEDAERRRSYLSFVVVGGGFSGVEVAGEINDLVRKSLRYFSNIPEDEVRITLIHSRDQLLPEMSPKLREDAQRRMAKAGIRILLQERVNLVTAEGAGLKSGTMVRGATVVSTVGTSILPFMECLEVPKERGRLVTELDMRVGGREAEWAIGDCAHVVNSYDDTISPPTGQFAERQGRQVALNIVRILKGEPTRLFRFRQLGQLCSIGAHRGVGNLLGIPVNGFPAWFIWRGIYLMKLPSWSRRVKVALDWAWELMFSRDLAHLKTDPSERITTAYFRSGDFLIRPGDPPSNLYVIKSGEVEVLQDDHLVAVLGPGDFVGELALAQDRPHQKAVRARSPVEAVVMGKNVLGRLSEALAPLQETFLNAIRRRTDIWQHFPRARELLAAESLSTFVQPLPADPLPLDTDVDELLRLFAERSQASFFVIDEDEHLAGIVSSTDVLRAIDIAAARPEGPEAVRRVRDIMTPNPVAVSEDVSPLVVVTTMRERGLKKLPVVASAADRRPVGCVHIERIVEHVSRRLRGTAEG